MFVNHIGIWSENPERLRDFYIHYFGATASEKYSNPRTQFYSFFLTLSTAFSIEIMYKPGLTTPFSERGNHMGYSHLAISLGSSEEVNRLTDILRRDGVQIIGEPRTTGDGFYESVVTDPDGNYLELTV